MATLKLNRNSSGNTTNFVNDEGKVKKVIEEEVDFNVIEALPAKLPIFGLYKYIRNLKDDNLIMIEKKSFQYGLDKYIDMWCYLYDKDKNDGKLSLTNMKLCLASYIKFLIQEVKETHNNNDLLRMLNTIESSLKDKAHFSDTFNRILSDAGYTIGDWSK